MFDSRETFNKLLLKICLFDSRETFIKLLLKIKQLPSKTCVKVKKKKMITDMEKFKCYTFI